MHPRRWARRTLLALAGVVALLALLAGAFALAAPTAAFNHALDARTIRLMARVAATGPAAAKGASLPYGTVDELERLTRPGSAPLAPAIEPLRRHRRSEPDLVQEEITFDSSVTVALAASNRARAYVYRHGPLGARPVVLWVPGQYVMDLAFVPIGWFLDEILARGVDVVLYVPPYHLERTPAGFDSGDAVLATTFPDHLAVFAQELSDLRRLGAWLRGRGVRTLGAWGGSVGAMLLLRAATWDAVFDFMTVFIPLLHLDDVPLSSPDAAPMRARFLREGRSLEEVQRLYRLLDPTGAAPRIDPRRVSVLYGRFDRVAAPEPVLAWARAWGVTRLRAADRGHALALFDRALYPAYGAFLEEDLRATASPLP